MDDLSCETAWDVAVAGLLPTAWPLPLRGFPGRLRLHSPVKPVRHLGETFGVAAVDLCPRGLADAPNQPSGQL